MRKITAAFIGTALAATALAGCTAAPGTSTSLGCSPVASGDGQTLSEVDVAGDFGAKPEISIPDKLAVTNADRAETIVGTGRQITSLNQVIGFDVTLISTVDGSELATTKYDGTQFAPTGSSFAEVPNFGENLLCAREGSRVVSVHPASAMSPDNAMALGMSGSSGVVAVVDIHTVMLAGADGSAEANTSFGLPNVVTAPNGRMGVVVPDAAAPTKAVVQTIVRGSGAKLTDTDRAVVNVLGVPWDKADDGSRTPFADTWSAGSPQLVNMAETDGLDPSVASALKGATIGSQLLVVSPADPDVEGSASVIYVLDVVGTL